MDYNYSEIYPIKTELHRKVIKFILDKYPTLVDIHIKGGDDYSFTLRNGYWEQIGDAVLHDVEKEFDCKINYFIDEDEDTGFNFIYNVVKNVVNNS
jgi:hypothetical protein